MIYKFKQILPFILLLALGIFLRTHRLSALAGFDYDGEKAAFWVWDAVVNHRFSLIGQEISVGGVFIGPLYNFFLIPFFLASKMDPIAESITVSIISTASLIMIFLTAKKYFTTRVALIAVYFFVFSFRLNLFDRTTAPSTLIIPLSVVTLYLLFYPEINWVTFFGLGVVVGLSFSVHPTAVLLFPIIFLFWLWKRRKISWPSIALFLVTTLILISPLIVFDLRHHFMNTTQAAKLLFSSSFASVGYPLFFKLLINLHTLVVLLTSLIFPNSGIILPPLLAVVTIVSFRYLPPKTKSQSLFLLFFVVPLLALSFYPANVIDYYFLLLVPVFLLLLANFVNHYLSGRTRIPVLFLLALFALVNLQSFYNYQNVFSYQDKRDVVSWIINDANGQRFSVNYATDLGQASGFPYLFLWQNKIPDLLGTRHYIIAIPPNRISQEGSQFGAIKVAHFP